MRIAPAFVLALCATPAFAGSLPMDAPIVVGGVETVCTGIGDGKNDPRWKAYPVRVEFSNAAAQYLAGAHVKLSDAAGAVVAEFDCSGAWVLLKLPRGVFSISATMNGQASAMKSAKLEPPATGQKRVVLEFDDIMGH